MSTKQDDFGRLLQESMELVDHIDTNGMPTLQKSIAQLDSVSRNISRNHSRDIYPHGDVDTKAQMFLARAQVDIAKHSRNLKQIDFSSAYECLEPIDELDVEKFLEHQHQMLVNTAIEESTKMTAITFRNHYINKIEDDWEKEKKNILESLATPKYLEPIQVSRALITSNIPKTTSGRRLLADMPTSEMTHCVETIQKLNEKRCTQNPFPLVDELTKTYHKIDRHLDRRDIGTDVMGLWSNLQYLIHGGRPKGPHALKIHSEKAYESFSLKKDRVNNNLRQRFIDGGRQFAEMLFETQEIEHVIYNNKDKAKVGGRPPFINKVRGYLRVLSEKRFPHQRRWNEDQGLWWAEMFYCFRSGKVEACFQLLAQSPLLKTASFPIFKECLHRRLRKEKLDPSLKNELKSKFRTEHSREQQHPDPFKTIMFCLVGQFQDLLQEAELQCENPIPGFLETTEDYMWVRLTLIDIDTPPTADASLEKLQERLQDPGMQKHFDPNGDAPLRYVRMLLLSQQFNGAVKYLLRSKPGSTIFNLGVHVAICLDYYGLLGSSESTFVDAIDKYIDLFKIINPVAAFHYLNLLRRSDGALSFDSSRDLPISESEFGINKAAIMKIKELIRTTRKFNLLVGTIRENGQVNKTGCVYQFFPKVAKNIIFQAGQGADAHENNYDAIILYKLAEMPDQVLKILIEKLGRLICEPTKHPDRTKLKDIAIRFLYEQKHAARQINSYDNTVSLDSLEYVVKLIKFFDLVNLGPDNYDSALTLIKQIPIIPEAGSDYRRQYDRVGDFHKVIQGHIGAIAEKCMKIYRQKYKSIKAERLQNNEANQDPVRQNILLQLKREAKVLVSFTGWINASPEHYASFPELHAKLVREEALMS